MPFADPVKQREAQRVSQKKHYAKNREAIVAKSAAYYRAHTEQCLRNQKRYVGENRERIRLRERARTKVRAEFILAYKKEHPCVDCGEGDPDVLVFDHRDPKTKKHAIANMVTNTIAAIKIEIEKCDVRCCNCHMKRTLRQIKSGEIVNRARKPTGVDSDPVLKALEPELWPKT